MNRLLPALGLLSAPLLLAAAPTGATPAAKPAVSSAPAPDAFDDAKRAAENTYMAGLEELADWCHGEKAYRSRDKAYMAVLLVDPEHKKARKFLKYTFDRKAKEWIRKRPYKEPKKGKPEIVKEARARRTALDSAYVEAQLAVIESFEGKISPKRQRGELEVLMAAAPDHPRVRELLGYVGVKKGDKIVWMTKAAKETSERRDAIIAALDEARDAVPDVEDVDLLSPEDELAVEWTVQLGNDRVRVIGDVDEDEAEQAAAIGYLAYDFLPFMVGGTQQAPPDFTYYLLADEGSKDDFISSYPGLSDADREAFPTLRSGWMPGNRVWRVGCWAEEVDQRLDVALKQTTASYLQYEYSIFTKRGWLSEGFGLYINQLVLGTRYSYSITITEYDDPSRPQTDREMADTEEDWLELAARILEDASPTLLAKTLGRNTTQMTADDIVLAYALVKYLREGYGRDAFASLCRKIGKEEVSSVVALEQFFDARIPEIQKKLLGWIEEVGGNDFE